MSASIFPGPLQEFYQQRLDRGHQAGNGAVDAGAQDCRHRSDGLEERRELRPKQTESTSSLSAETGQSLRVPDACGRRTGEALRVRG
jgi:hypothetical protein